MKTMIEQLLVEESIGRASARLGSMLGLVRQTFADGRNRAHAIATANNHIIDPEAASLFEEAEVLLISTAPRLEPALVALLLASAREPLAYAQTFMAMYSLLEQALTEASEAELAEQAIGEHRAGHDAA